MYLTIYLNLYKSNVELKKKNNLGMLSNCKYYPYTVELKFPVFSYLEIRSECIAKISKHKTNRIEIGKYHWNPIFYPLYHTNIDSNKENLPSAAPAGGTNTTL